MHNCKILGLNTNLKYIVLRTGNSTDRVTKGHKYIIEWGKVWSNGNKKDAWAWVIKNTDKPIVKSQPSIHAKSACWKVIASTCGKHIIQDTKNIEGWYRRIGAKNYAGTSFTIDKLYRLVKDGDFLQTVDDNGKKLRRLCIENWEFVCGTNPNDPNEEPQIEDEEGYQHAPDYIEHAKFLHDPSPTPAPTPAVIEYADFIGELNAETFDDDALINRIMEEEAAITHLRQVATPSKYIQNLIAKHQTAANNLAEILDKREVP